MIEAKRRDRVIMKFHKPRDWTKKAGVATVSGVLVLRKEFPSLKRAITYATNHKLRLGVSLQDLKEIWNNHFLPGWEPACITHVTYNKTTGKAETKVIQLDK